MILPALAPIPTFLSTPIRGASISRWIWGPQSSGGRPSHSRRAGGRSGAGELAIRIGPSPGRDPYAGPGRHHYQRNLLLRRRIPAGQWECRYVVVADDAGRTPIMRGGSNLAPPLGVCGTPVADAANRRLFVTAMWDDGSGTGHYTMFNIALDTGAITTSQELVDAGAAGRVTFNTDVLDQRTAINLEPVGCGWALPLLPPTTLGTTTAG
jgi:hypothetical protein